MIAWFAGQPLPTQIGLAILAAALLSILTFFAVRKFIKLGHQEDLEAKDRVGLQIEFIKTAAQILGGLFFLVTIYVAWANLVVSQEKHKTDLFTKAIEQLGNEKQIEVRLGGIYALERIARDSEKDHGPIMEVLTAFVRLHAPWPPKKPAEAKETAAESGKLPPGEKKPKTEAEEIKPRADIQAILTVLGRRARTYGKGETQPLDLHETDLRGADLREAHLEGADLHKAHLEGAILQGATQGKLLRFFSLFKKAFPNRAYQEGPSLVAAHLEWANLQEAHLQKAFLSGAHMNRASLEGAHLNGASLVAAYLEGAYLEGAHLKGADLIGAHLEGADLRMVEGLTQKNIDSAIIDEKTKLPDYLKKADPDKAKPQ